VGPVSPHTFSFFMIENLFNAKQPGPYFTGGIKVKIKAKLVVACDHRLNNSLDVLIAGTTITQLKYFVK